jgi:transposase InsO family protein
MRGRPDPEFVAMAIRDWCREHGTGTAYIEPGSPWQNPYVEGFNGKLRDELFSREVFDTIMEARLLFRAIRAGPGPLRQLWSTSRALPNTRAPARPMMLAHRPAAAR